MARKPATTVDDALVRPLTSEAALLDGYRGLAEEVESETEAAEWVDGLLADAVGDDR